MRRRYARMIALCLFALVPLTARASIFGEENAILGQMLAQDFRQSAQLAAAVQQISQGVQLARATVAFANDAVQVVENVEQIVKDPIGFLKSNAISFAKSFPGVAGLMQDSQTLERRIRYFGQGINNTYNPYAFLRVLDDVKAMQGGYHPLQKLVDKWNVSEPHYQAIEDLRAHRERTAGLISSVSNDVAFHKLNPQRAAVYNAQASVITADTNVEMAALQHDLAAERQMRLVTELEANAKIRAEKLTSDTQGRANIPSTWDLPTQAPQN